MTLMAQHQPKIVNLRPYDQTGINKFEDEKEDNATFDGLKMRFGVGITQQFQNLKDENSNEIKNDIGFYSNSGTVAGNKL